MNRVLIIDDETKIREIYARVLRWQKIDVMEASGAREATNILIRNKIDLILLDIQMPGIGGTTMFEVIEEYDPDVAVIVISSFSVGIQKKIIPQANSYYDKSEGFSVLMNRVMDVFSNGRKELV